jgi:hypothetical protein
MRQFRNTTSLRSCFYHFYARFANGQQRNAVETWNSLAEAITKNLKLNGGELNAFLLMGNHFHGVVQIEPSVEDFWRQEFTALCPIPIEEKLYMILSENHSVLIKTLKYIYLNPVEAGLAKTALEFPFSTCREILRPKANPELRKLGIVHDPLHLIHRSNIGFSR